MAEVDFYQLPRAVQDDLIDNMRGQFAPVPILGKPGTRPTVLGWLAVGAGAWLVLAGLFWAGFGDVGSGLALHPTAVGAVYVLLAATAIFSLIRAMAIRGSLKALPFAPGVFLFPANVIDARDHKLRVFPLAALSGVTAEGGTVVVRFEATAFSFPAGPLDPAEAVRLVEAARDRMKEGPDAAELRKLDPLEKPAVESPLASHVPLSRKAPAWERLAWLLAAGAGAGFGVGLFTVRNVMSDAKMFATAQALDEVAGYQSYLGRGERHTEAVSQVLLPRAELRLAVAKGSVEAIDTFLRAYPTTGIQTEVDAARRAALVVELERAKKAGTLAALLAFAELYPKHGLDETFGKARHAIYTRALARFKAEMPKGGEANVAFVEKLLAYAERTGARKTAQGYRGPTALVRFRRLPSKDLERADDLVRKSPMFGGVTSLPTRYADAAHVEPHEKGTSVALAEALARGFDPEILTFEPGPLFEGTDEEAVAQTAPTLLVSYRIESSGAAYANKRPPSIFMGFVYFFETRFIVPGDPKPVQGKHTTAQRIPTELLREVKGVPPPGTLETAVYAEIMRGAFAEVQQRFLGKWSKKADAPK